MKAFRFRLQTVLDFRCKREEIEQKKYHPLAEEVARIDDEIRRVGETRVSLMKSALIQESDFDLDRFKRELAYAEHLSRLLDQLNRKRTQAEAARSNQQALLIEAVKKRKILEILRARARREFNHETGLQERRELDEWAVTQHGKTPLVSY